MDSDNKNNELIVEDQNQSLAVSNDLKELANMVNSNQDITQAIGSDAVNNIKAWLLIYTRSQLSRVIKLTTTLSSLEDRVLTMANDKDVELSIDEICKLIGVIQGSLKSTIDLIKQVTSDESYLNVIVHNTNIVNNTLNEYNGMTINNASDVILKNKRSREKVRDAVGVILNQLDNIGTNKTVDGEIKDEK